MAKTVVLESWVDVVGGIWMPYGAVCSMRYPLSVRDVQHIIEESGKVDRESVADWLARGNAGDFSSVMDFQASIETPDGDTVDIPFESEKGEVAYFDTIREEVA